MQRSNFQADKRNGETITFEGVEFRPNGVVAANILTVDASFEVQSDEAATTDIETGSLRFKQEGVLEQKITKYEEYTQNVTWTIGSASIVTLTKNGTTVYATINSWSNLIGTGFTTTNEPLPTRFRPSGDAAGSLIRGALSGATVLAIAIVFSSGLIRLQAISESPPTVATMNSVTGCTLQWETASDS